MHVVIAQHRHDRHTRKRTAHGVRHKGHRVAHPLFAGQPLEVIDKVARVVDVIDARMLAGNVGAYILNQPAGRIAGGIVAPVAGGSGSGLRCAAVAATDALAALGRTAGRIQGIVVEVGQMQNGQVLEVGIACVLLGGVPQSCRHTGAQIHGNRVAAGAAVCGLVENGTNALAVVRMTRRRLVLQNVADGLLQRQTKIVCTSVFK